MQTSACAACSIKGHCTSADVSEKLIDIVSADSASYKPGDHVWVVGQVSMGMLAVLLAFVVPLFILIASLFIAMSVFHDELWAVCCALPCLVVYYFILWLNRSRMKKRFSFTIFPLD